MPRGGNSPSRRLSTCARVRPPSRITTCPACLTAPSTQASGTGSGPANGTVRMARTVSGSLTGGAISTSHDSATAVAFASPRRPPGADSIRRAVTVPVAGGSSDHSSNPSIGSEN